MFVNNFRFKKMSITDDNQEQEEGDGVKWKGGDSQIV